MSRHRCYPVFLGQAGCPFQCVYCRQQAIVEGPAGGDLLPEALGRIDQLAEHAKGHERAGEIAFYGGTFTLLERSVRRTVLDRAAAWVDRGRFSGIRFSTRPDALDDGIIKGLADYPIRTVELGVQSLSDGVLQASRRGYRAACVVDAARRVRACGWNLGCQLMLGLPRDSREDFLETVRRVTELDTQLVRLYPTLVLSGTVLAKWWRTGRYQPLSLDQAVDWCSEACEIFEQAGIAVVRMGLHPDERLRRPGVVLAGPFHPGFGYLVKCRRWLKRIESELETVPNEVDGGRSLFIRVASRCVSEVIGFRRENLSILQRQWQFKRVRVQGEPRWLADEMEMVISDENPFRGSEEAVSSIGTGDPPANG